MFKMLNFVLIGLFFLISSFSTLAVTLTPEQQKGKEEGIRLYQQFSNDHVTVENLLPAAEAGDTEAMVYLGIVLRILSHFDANVWLEKAAEAGDIYAMYQLTQGMPAWNIVPGMENQDKVYWQAKGEALALERAKQGDLESMYIYYRFTDDIDWLEKAANGGWADAQEALSRVIGRGDKPYHRLPERKRREQEAKWLELSADNGNPVAAYRLYLYYDDKNWFPDKLKRRKAYLLKSVEQSYIKAIYTYIDELIDNTSATEEDLIKAYALASIYQNTGQIVRNGAGTVKLLTEGSYHYPHIKPLTPEQIKQALILKEEWVKTHPPLTNYFSKMKIIGDMFSY